MQQFRDLAKSQFVKGGNKASNAKYAKLAKKIARAEMIKSPHYRKILEGVEVEEEEDEES